MPHALPFFLYIVVLAPVLLGHQLGDGWTFLTPLGLFGGLGALDMIIGRGKTGGYTDAHSPAHRLAPMLWLPFQLALIVWLLFMVSRHELTILEIIGMTLSVGAIGGAVGIVFAHELTHRMSWLERRLADALMVSVTYHHFCVEHVHGHHRTVGTPKDPATARLNESFYRFFPRATIGGLISAWHLEVKRMRRRGRGPFTWRNWVLSGLIAQAAMYAVAGLIFGWPAIFVLAGVGLAAVFQLEVINYLEHYGLERRRSADGRLEPMGPHHSWDDDHRLSSWFLVNLTHHADHHMRPGEPYQRLEQVEGAGKLPFGYATSFLFVLVPPVWFRMMNPRVEALKAAHSI
ncbi:MAG: alkane 1-monooxygenase [Rhodospirillaceae bacterium]|nr:alkane 1-monooxygenase [Rhodospirillaceae bacterium]